jgi:hypothetical protein
MGHEKKGQRSTFSVGRLRLTILKGGNMTRLSSILRTIIVLGFFGMGITAWIWINDPLVPIPPGVSATCSEPGCLRPATRIKQSVADELRKTGHHEYAGINSGAYCDLHDPSLSTDSKYFWTFVVWIGLLLVIFAVWRSETMRN